MSKKMGRPTDDPKVEYLNARLSASERDALAFIRKQLGLSKSDATRKALLMAAEQLQAA